MNLESPYYEDKKSCQHATSLFFESLIYVAEIYTYFWRFWEIEMNPFFLLKQVMDRYGELEMKYFFCAGKHTLKIQY